MSHVGHLQPYIDELAIEHPIEFEAQGKETQVASVYDVEGGKHRIVYPDRVKDDDLATYNPSNPFLGNFVHELCHLHLAEKIAPSFAGIRVEGDETQKGLFMTADNQVVDLWVNDLFNARFPDLSTQHYSSYAKQTAGFIKDRDWFFLLPPTAPFTLGRNEAEALRHGFTQIDFCRALQRAGFNSKELRNGTHRKLLPYIEPALATQFSFKTPDKLWDYMRQQRGEVNPQTMQDIGAIRDFFVDTPTLACDRSEALAMHEEVVNAFCKIGKLAVRARLVDEHPRPTWYLSS